MFDQSDNYLFIVSYQKRMTVKSVWSAKHVDAMMDLMRWRHRCHGDAQLQRQIMRRLNNMRVYRATVDVDRNVGW